MLLLAPYYRSEHMETIQERAFRGIEAANGQEHVTDGDFELVASTNRNHDIASSPPLDPTVSRDAMSAGHRMHPMDPTVREDASVGAGEDILFQILQHKNENGQDEGEGNRINLAELIGNASLATTATTEMPHDSTQITFRPSLLSETHEQAQTSEPMSETESIFTSQQTSNHLVQYAEQNTQVEMEQFKAFQQFSDQGMFAVPSHGQSQQQQQQQGRQSADMDTTLFEQPGAGSATNQHPGLSNLLAVAMMSPDEKPYDTPWSDQAPAVNPWQIPPHLQSPFAVSVPTPPPIPPSFSLTNMQEAWYVPTTTIQQHHPLSQQFEALYARRQRTLGFDPARIESQDYFPYTDTTISESSSVTNSAMFTPHHDRAINLPWNHSNHMNIQSVTETEIHRRPNSHEPPFSSTPVTGPSPSFRRTSFTISKMPATVTSPPDTESARELRLQTEGDRPTETGPNTAFHEGRQVQAFERHREEYPSSEAAILIRHGDEYVLNQSQSEHQCSYYGTISPSKLSDHRPIPEPFPPSPTGSVTTEGSPEERIERLRTQLVSGEQHQLTPKGPLGANKRKRRLMTPPERYKQTTSPAQVYPSLSSRVSLPLPYGAAIGLPVVRSSPMLSSRPFSRSPLASPSTHHALSMPQISTCVKPEYRSEYTASPSPSSYSSTPREQSAELASKLASKPTAKRSTTSASSAAAGSSSAADTVQNFEPAERRMLRRRERNRLAARRSRDKKNSQFADMKDKHDMLVEECARLREQVMLLDQRNRLLETHAQQLMTALERLSLKGESSGDGGGGAGSFGSFNGVGVGVTGAGDGDGDVGGGDDYKGISERNSQNSNADENSDCEKKRSRRTELHEKETNGKPNESTSKNQAKDNNNRRSGRLM